MAVISFARGIPSPDILPLEEFAECARAAVERDGRTVLNYGPPGGYGPLREWIAERHGVPAARVVLTNGSLQGLRFVLLHLLGGGGRALVEAPTYDRTLSALQVLGARVDAVPLADDGIDVSALAEALETGARPTLLYMIPTFQNPSGRTLSRASREALAELVSRYELLVFEDDPYRLVRFEGEELPTVHELTGGDRVIFSSSFSKTAVPGIRVGYLVLPESLVEPVEALALETYISPSLFVQGALFEFIRTGRFRTNLEHVRAALRARRDAMTAALEREFGETARWSEPEGGYFIWLDLPAGVDARALLAAATEAGVTFVPGVDFYVHEGGEESARLAFSFASVAEIEEGVRRLGRLVRETAAVAA